MQSKRLWARAVGVDRRVVIEGVGVDEGDDSVVVSCRLRKNAMLRCGECERRSGHYDSGEGRRRWRSLDAGTTKVFIEADAPRVRCRDHGAGTGRSRRR